MRAARVLLMNCFVLVVPILVLNVVCADRLPEAMFGRDVFWHAIPPAVAYGENALRVVLIAVPVLIPLRWRPVGLAVYAAGLAIYVASWAALIGWLDSAWSTSAAGLLAPAYTPIVWAIGIGLIGPPRLGRHTVAGCQRTGRILMIVATLEGSRGCDGRQRSAGTGAANRQA